MSDWNYVNTRASYYSGTAVKDFLGVPAIDLKHYPINSHFQEASDFIERILKRKGKMYSYGKVEYVSTSYLIRYTGLSQAIPLRASWSK